jgi:hypothetical protein
MHFAFGSEKYIITEPENGYGNHQQKEYPYEPVPFQDGKPRPGNGSGKVKQSHWYGIVIEDMSASSEENNRTGVGRHIHEFCMGTGMEKIISENTDKKKHKKAARPGADKSVIKTNDQRKKSTVNKFL